MRRSLLSNSRKLENMLTHFPKAVPEIPVSNVEKAAEYYVNVLGFHFDWGNDQGGIGGISQGECRMFLTNAPFRQHYGSGGTVMVWLSLGGDLSPPNENGKMLTARTDDIFVRHRQRSWLESATGRARIRAEMCS